MDNDLNRRIAEALGWTLTNPGPLTGWLAYHPVHQADGLHVAPHTADDAYAWRAMVRGGVIPNWSGDLNAAWRLVMDSGMHIEQPLTWGDWSTPKKYATWLCNAWLAWKGQGDG